MALLMVFSMVTALTSLVMVVSNAGIIVRAFADGLIAKIMNARKTTPVTDRKLFFSARPVLDAAQVRENWFSLVLMVTASCQARSGRSSETDQLTSVNLRAWGTVGGRKQTKSQKDGVRNIRDRRTG